MALATGAGLTLPGPPSTAAAGTGIRGSSVAFGSKPFISHRNNANNSTASLPRAQLAARYGSHSVSAAVLDYDGRSMVGGRGQRVPAVTDNWQVTSPHGDNILPEALYRLLDPNATVEFPPLSKVSPRALDNRELDKLVAALGRNKATWRRSLLLHEWLLSIGHLPDDRLCTTLMRVCSQHGQAMSALSLYDWMRTPQASGGAGLRPTVYTYTAAMRAALSGNLLDRALAVWDDALASRQCEPDCRMCTTLIEVCARRGDTPRALTMYEQMRRAERESKMAPSVHAYTAAMRAAAEGGQWARALEIWSDMEGAGCKPTGHAYAAVISACAAGGDWQRAVSLFDEMLEWRIKPDVVSCTALVTALGSDGQCDRAEKVVEWMLRSDIKPNVRTYTALVTAMGNARQWDRALGVIARMRTHALGGIEPNAYTYSALLKTMGEQGKWQLAEGLFAELEEEALSWQHAERPAPFPRAGAGADSAAADVASTSGREQFNWNPAPQQGFATKVDDVISAAATPSQLARDMGKLGFEGLDAAQGGAKDPDSQYGVVPTQAAEEVLQRRASEDSPRATVDGLPDEILGQSNVGSPADEPFSFFSAADPAVQSPAKPQASRPADNAWTSSNAALSGLQLNYYRGGGYGAIGAPAPPAGSAPWGSEKHEKRVAAGGKAKGPVNEVVCGALMLAYERAGKWEDAVRVLGRARGLGIQPNTIMYNTAMSALGKCGQWESAKRLFLEIPQPDAVSYETLIAAYGMSGEASQAEASFQLMLDAGFTPRDYAYCGLIAAHSMQGDWKQALRVRTRMQRAAVPMTVHAYNALIAACERSGQWDAALDLHRCMRREGVEGNNVTQALLTAVGQKGVASIESQQAAAAALSAAVAAAGTLIMRSGLF